MSQSFAYGIDRFLALSNVRNEYAEAYFEECMALKRELREQRAAVIEECARVAQQWLIRAEQGSGEDLIDTIRALKDKP